MPGIADTTAAPAMISIGRLWWRRTLLLSPLTIGDLGWYDRMGGYDRNVGNVGRQDTLFLIWLSLRRHQPWLSWNKCRRLFRLMWRCRLAFHVIMEINPTAFNADDESQATDGGDGNAVILRSLAMAYKWPPSVACDLTVEQATLYLQTGDKGGSPERMYFSSREEAHAYVALRQKEKAAE